jgi:LmbE family N-acetylglucosaminyl deacetylase
MHAATMRNIPKLTLMAVHAHPDDESSATGGVLARYSDEGVTTVLVTCTNGEYGDGPEHVKPGEAGHDPSQVGKTRLAELDEACRQLGVHSLETLGYHDSGMPEWPYRNEGHTFCNVPIEESLSRVVDLVEKYRPDVMITYNESDGRNHPDHVQAHRLAVEAFRVTGIPAKLYFIVRRRPDQESLRDRLRGLGIDIPLSPVQQAPSDPDVIRRIEEAQRRITTTIDTTSVAARKRNALAAHASQLDRAWWTPVPHDYLGEVFANETFIRAEDRTGAPLPEDDLFAGLR